MKNISLLIFTLIFIEEMFLRYVRTRNLKISVLRGNRPQQDNVDTHRRNKYTEVLNLKVNFTVHSQSLSNSNEARFYQAAWALTTKYAAALIPATKKTKRISKKKCLYETQNRNNNETILKIRNFFYFSRFAENLFS